MEPPGNAGEQPPQFVAHDRKSPLGADQPLLDKGEAAAREKRILQHQDLGVEKIRVRLTRFVGQASPQIREFGLGGAKCGLQPLALQRGSGFLQMSKRNLSLRALEHEGLSEHTAGGDGEA